MNAPTRRSMCILCQREYAVTQEGRLRAHDASPGRRCRGSGAKVAKTRKAARKSAASLPAGLPTLGKRNR